MSDRRYSRGLVAIAAFAAIVAAAWFAFDRFIREPQAVEQPIPVVAAAPPSPDAGAAMAMSTQARIVSVKGAVQRRSGAETWSEVKQGEVLAENERLRTGSGASAELAVGDRGTFKVSESTEVGVVELSEAMHRFRLIRGRVTADYAPDGRRTLRIEGEQGQTATAEGGKFSVLATPTTFSVATERGRVNLESAGKVIAVDEGRQSVAHEQLAPTAPVPIPADVLLLATRGRARGCTEIVGSAAAGSEVSVGDTLVAADERGHFAVKLAATTKAGQVMVRTRDATGRVQTRVVKCPPPKANSEVNAIAIKRWHKNPP